MGSCLSIKSDIKDTQHLLNQNINVNVKQLDVEYSEEEKAIEKDTSLTCYSYSYSSYNKENENVELTREYSFGQQINKTQDPIENFIYQVEKM